MDKQIKQQWLDALRSGNYEQGKFWLRYGKKDGESNFCCLGVLCDIYRQSHDQDWRFFIEDEDSCGDEASSEPFSFMCEGELLPVEVAEWAGFSMDDSYSAGDYYDGKVKVGPHYIDCTPVHSLADLNDKGKTFEEIADIIEKEL